MSFRVFILLITPIAITVFPAITSCLSIRRIPRNTKKAPDSIKMYLAGIDEFTPSLCSIKKYLTRRRIYKYWDILWLYYIKQ